VENKLIEETDYELEVEQSQVITKACQHISGLKFPNYYAQWSSQRIITMDWMEGIHLSEFTQKNDDLELGNQIGQTLWDFYMFQIHKLKKVQADPHPGNFLISENNELIALDFGCMKTIPEDFYAPYFELASGEVLNRPEQFEKKLEELEILKSTDTAEDRVFFRTMFHELLSLFARPFQSEYFDFSDEGFFNEIASMGEQYSKNTELRKMDANRGSKHFIYMNRTFFGLYNLLHDLKGHHIKINNI
jgi:predicted unusual protein kinase regulating ubiquinone biosynthesis (AarF/ABC1/UbiB family)